jgi:hypothetical protein
MPKRKYMTRHSSQEWDDATTQSGDEAASQSGDGDGVASQVSQALQLPSPLPILRQH